MTSEAVTALASPRHDVAPDWQSLQPGRQLDVIKLSPEGSEVARYPGTVVALHSPERWVVIQATWTYREIALDGLVFSPGDSLLEWFSPDCMFNAFAVYTPTSSLRGWYANVTHPAYLVPGEVSPTLAWHDLYLDLVGLPNGAQTMRDEDELRDSGLAYSNPELWQSITAAGQELARRFQSGVAPFLRLPQLEAEIARCHAVSDFGDGNESESGPDFVHPH